MRGSNRLISLTSRSGLIGLVKNAAAPDVLDSFLVASYAWLIVAVKMITGIFLVFSSSFNSRNRANPSGPLRMTSTTMTAGCSALATANPSRALVAASNW